MDNKQQTAVEWFLIECGKYGDTAQIPDEVIDQAKEMEKERIETYVLNQRTSRGLC